MSRRLIVGPRADSAGPMWPVMLLDATTPGVIRGDMFVTSYDELCRLGDLHRARVEIAPAVRAELPGVPQESTASAGPMSTTV